MSDLRPTIAALLSLLLLGGCGGSSKTAPVAGTIAVNKKPQANLLIQFHPVGGSTGGGSGTSTEGGKFEILGADGKPGLLPGDYIVTVADANLEVADEDLGKGKRIAPNRVDKKYQSTDAKINPLTIKVVMGKGSYELALD